MFDTTITVIGNVLTAPEWRRTKNTNTLVLNFKVASTSRRLDRDSGQWVDGTNLRVRVTCWRRLAENVAVSVMLGDPVIVHGRVFTREWYDEEGTKHLAYELEADSVGHDLARGVSKFARRRAATSTDVVDGPEIDAVIAGQLSDPVDEPELAEDVSACRSLLDDFSPVVFDPGAVTAALPGSSVEPPIDGQEPTGPHPNEPAAGAHAAGAPVRANGTGTPAPDGTTPAVAAEPAPAPAGTRIRRAARQRDTASI